MSGIHYVYKCPHPIHLCQTIEVLLFLIHIFDFYSNSTVSLENLESCLQVLANLPANFKEELDACVSDVRQIVSQLLNNRVQV